ncbi:MAG: acyloxyacyl hydrolase [Bacteroidales bacterium]|nr:acyloxyacyl hydrolase [Bacteroidales bacterium]
MLLCCLLGNKQVLYAQTHADKDIFLGVNVRPSYVMPTHGFYNGWNPSGSPIRKGNTFDMQLGVRPGERGAYQGVGLAAHTFFEPESIGNPATLYVFQGAPLVSFAESLALGYEWNLGLSYGWKDNGVVTVSPFNVYISIAALLTWRFDGYWDMTFGPEFTHFSNGDTKFPNGGTNTLNLRVGIRRSFKPAQAIITENVFSAAADRKGIEDRLSYDLTAMGGWRADRTIDKDGLHIFNKAFPIASISFNPLYSFNGYFAAGPSLDLMYDHSADLLVSEGSILGYPSFLQQTSAGLSARAELKMPVFAVNIGIGYGLPLANRTRSSDMKALYGIFSLKTFMTRRLFFNVSYRLSSVLYSHNLLFGIGWRFGKNYS